MLTGATEFVQSHGALCFCRGPGPGLVLCHHHHEICYKFWTNSPAFSVCTGPHKWCSCLLRPILQFSESRVHSPRKSRGTCSYGLEGRPPSMKSVPVNFTPYSLLVISQLTDLCELYPWAECPCTSKSWLCCSNLPDHWHLTGKSGFCLIRQNIYLIYIYIYKLPITYNLP